MKVAVPSTTDSPEADVNPRFGRADYFIIFDTDSGESEVITNTANSSSGAGIGSAKTVIDAGADVVLAGNCGPNAAKTLQAAKVEIYTGVSGSVQKAYTDFLNGKLSATGRNVEAHFGTGDNG